MFSVPSSSHAPEVGHDDTSGSIDPISDRTRELIETYILLFAGVPFGIVGCLANIVNLIVIFRQGIQDCVSVCLFSLAISDFLSIFTGLVFNVYYIDTYLDHFLYVNPVVLDFLISHICAMFYDVSQAITAFISLERCLCVALPLKFKDMFTFRRALVAVVGFYVIIVCAYIPHFLSSGHISIRDPITNITRVTFWMSADRDIIDAYLNSVVHIGFASVNQIIVLVSTQVMIAGLKRSSRFRQRELTLSSASKNLNKKDSKSQLSKKNGQGRGLSTKNSNVVKTVMALAIISVICNSFRLGIVYGRRFNTDVGFTGRLANSYAVLLRLLFFFQTTNASSNLLVYLNLNPSFAAMFMKTFGCRRNEKGNK